MIHDVLVALLLDFTGVSWMVRAAAIPVMMFDVRIPFNTDNAAMLSSGSRSLQLSISSAEQT
jgi:hypothetical protein